MLINIGNRFYFKHITGSPNLCLKIYFIEAQVFCNVIFFKTFLAKRFMLDKIWLAIFCQYLLFGTSQFALYVDMILTWTDRVF